MGRTPEPTDEAQSQEGRRTGVVVSVRLKPEEADLLEALSERDGRSLSETLRVALHAFARQPSDLNRLDQAINRYTRGGREIEVSGGLAVLSHA
jgi:predicted DNA-binding protein